MRNIALIIIVILLISCSSQTIYLKPEIKGQIIDENTMQPIREKGYIASFVNDNNKNAVSTDKEGYFLVPAPVDKRIFGHISEQEFQQITPEVYFYIDGYMGKIIDYRKYIKTPLNPSKYQKSFIDLGRVYLQPEK